MKKLFVLSLLSNFLLTGCGDNMPPDCSNKETVNLVKDISKTELIRQFEYLSNTNITQFETVRIGLEKLRLGKFELLVNNIRTVKKDEQSKKYVCAAELIIPKIQEDGSDAKHPITYTSSLTDDKSKIYVEVHGLR
ncbi:hypothetical protein RHO14_03485 [Orbus wheelerorum]|uniref:hypothetical protein n=1 Tax=Orbus wheelerorum TaxID=3074111 RepID=UPI00370D1AC0